MSDIALAVRPQRMYATREFFKNSNRFGSYDSDESTDKIVDRALAAATANFEQMTGRIFLPYLQEKKFDFDRSRQLWLQDDLLSITTITDAQGTMSSSDIILSPTDAPYKQRPYAYIRVADVSSRFFNYETTPENAITIDGKWGFWEHEWPSTETVDGAVSDSATELTVSVGDDFETGQFLKVGSEYLLITRVQSTKLTVSRGMLGSTAASISNGASITRIEPPEDVRTAVCIIAARDMARSATGYSDRAGSNVEGYTYFKSIPAEVAATVRRYQRRTIRSLKREYPVWG